MKPPDDKFEFPVPASPMTDLTGGTLTCGACLAAADKETTPELAFIFGAIEMDIVGKKRLLMSFCLKHTQAAQKYLAAIRNAEKEK